MLKLGRALRTHSKGSLRLLATVSEITREQSRRGMVQGFRVWGSGQQACEFYVGPFSHHEASPCGIPFCNSLATSLPYTLNAKAKRMVIMKARQEFRVTPIRKPAKPDETRKKPFTTRKTLSALS